MTIGVWYRIKSGVHAGEEGKCTWVNYNGTEGDIRLRSGETTYQLDWNVEEM